MSAGQEPRTAVIIVHGMGEQRPMETLWGFVDAVWRHDGHVVPPSRNDLFSEPYPLARDYELRRVTTRHARLEGGKSKRVDFFEFYWAHLMTGNTVDGLKRWVRELLIRRPASVPRRLIWPWRVGGALYLIGVLCLAVAVVGRQNPSPLPGIELSAPLVMIAGAVTAAIGFVARAWAVPVAGDAARYLSATPDNVRARQQIRERGVAMLRALHPSDAGDRPRYDRIVIVGHSLGSVIAYDMVNYLWGEITQAEWARAHAEGKPAAAALEALEAAGAALKRERSEASLSGWRDAQRAYFRALGESGAPWIISDLVTLGSPLSKADVLLAKDAAQFEVKKGRRELPTSPPWPDSVSGAGDQPHFSFAPAGKPPRIPHNGAAFAPTVWTNIWFPSAALLFGDIISGEVAPLLGPGIRDVRIPIGAPRFRHLDYWRSPETASPWIVALRRALNLKGESEAALWSGPDGSREGRE